MQNRATGIWYGAFLHLNAAEIRATAKNIEDAGFGSIWFPESLRVRAQEAFTLASLLLCSTEDILVATGIANIWMRDAAAAAQGHLTLSEAYPGRFILGLGVGHKDTVDESGHDFGSPLSVMRGYLERMDGIEYRAVMPVTRPTRVLGALNPKMLELARAKTDGAHTFLSNPQHTAMAREILGPEALLVPQQPLVAEQSARRARSMGRRYMASPLASPDYPKHLRRLGYSESDLEGGGSDRLIDACVAWGDRDALRGRIDEHLHSGADYVCVQPVFDDDRAMSPREWERLAELCL